MKPDTIQQRALETWYEDGDDLQKCPYPCLLGLAGETGELVDLLKKSAYKHKYRVERKQWLEEAGDVLFYLSIRCYQLGLRLEDLPMKPEQPISQNTWVKSTIGNHIILMNSKAAELLLWYWFNIRRMDREQEILAFILDCIQVICNEFRITLDQLSWQNYEKLTNRESNGTGYNRGIE